MSDYGSTPPPPPQPPQQPPQQPPYGSQGVPGTPPPDNYLVWAILSTFLCCLPLGIASIVFSTQVNTKWAMGDIAGAKDSAEKAKKFAMWAAIAWVGLIVVYFLVWIALTVGLFGLGVSLNNIQVPVPSGFPS
jgi:Interferon-induced transmembrane protein